MRTAGEGRLREIDGARPNGLAAWANREMWQAAFHVADCAGATGAGDSAIAGFLVAYLHGCSLERCLQYACAAGAFSVTAPAALSGLRPWDEMVATVEAGWERNPLEVTGEGWSRAQKGLWLGPHDASG